MLSKLRLISKRLVIGLNLVAVLLILLAYLSAYISPEKLPYLALFGIAYPISLGLNLLFIIFWVLVRKQFALLSLIAILIGYNHLAAYYQLLPPINEKKGSHSISVVSQNVKLFGWYNWRSNKKDRDEMIKNLQGEAADVYCFQEFFSHRTAGVFDTKSILRRKLKTSFVHEIYPVTLYDNQQFGAAIFSKYPIFHKGEIIFKGEKGNICIYADIVKEKDTIRVYSAHVASIRFSDSDYKFMNDMKADGQQVAGSKRILQRLSNAYIKRARQVNEIVAHAKKSPYKVIICGDFNDTPVSYSYGQLASEFEDSFRESGWGIGNTYRGIFPSFRIDYIMHSPGMVCADYKTLPETISDHHAISSRMVWE